HEQDPARDAAVLLLALAEHLPVDDGFLDRDRQHFVRTEADGVLELVHVLDAADLEDPDADPVVRDSEANTLAGPLVALEEVLQCGREALEVAELAADDHARLEILARDLDQLRDAVVVDARCG